MDLGPICWTQPDPVHLLNNPTQHFRTNKTRPNPTPATLSNSFMSVASRSHKGTQCILILSHTELSSKALQTPHSHDISCSRCGPNSPQPTTEICDPTRPNTTSIDPRPIPMSKPGRSGECFTSVLSISYYLLESERQSTELV